MLFVLVLGALLAVAARELIRQYRAGDLPRVEARAERLRRRRDGGVQP